MDMIKKDHIHFERVSSEGEGWLKWKPGEEFVVYIYINGKEIRDILKEQEMKYVDEPEHAGAYGHMTAYELYLELAEALIPGSYANEDGAYIVCCSDCGEAGSWSAPVTVEQDRNYIYWKRFEHDHRDWKYDISYVFDRTEYMEELMSLKEMMSEDWETQRSARLLREERERYFQMCGEEKLDEAVIQDILRL